MRILTRYEIGGSLLSRFTKIGSIGDFWERGDVVIYPFSSTSKGFQWAIEAEVTNNTNMVNTDGIIAIDDITFDPLCQAATSEMPIVFTTTAVPICGVNGFRCSNGKCINKTQICDFQPDCLNGEDEVNCGICNFENSNCGWYDNSFGDHIWNRTKAVDADIPKDVSLSNLFIY